MIAIDEKINLDELCARVEKEETASMLAVADMLASGSIYQSQKDFDFYMINGVTFEVLRLDRWIKVWNKEKGLSFKWVYSQKWKKIN